MSTVLWANCLLDGHVTSDEADKYALYRHSGKLDRITQQLGVLSFIDCQDTTDAEFNMTDTELPPGMESTDELMAVEGRWCDAGDAVAMLEALIRDIRASNTRFGWLSNDQPMVLKELEESLKFARAAAAKGARFNFAVVM